jgi:hypothetical protein
VRRNREYALSASTVQVTFAGPVPVLESVDTATIVAAVEVGELRIGRHEVDVTVAPIDGLELLDVAPSTIRVDVSQAAAPSSSVVPTVAAPSHAAATEGPAGPGAP